MTKDGNIITFTVDNFVAPRLSSSPSSSSDSSSKPTGQINSSGEPEASSDSVTTRSDKPACGKPQTDPDNPATGNRGPAHKKNELDKEDPAQSIPAWLQPIHRYLEDMETHVPVHSSERENSDSGRCYKSGDIKTEAQYTHFPKDRNCDVCLRTKITRVSCRRRSEGSISRAEKFGDLITADQKPSTREVNTEQSQIRCRGKRSRHYTIFSV